MELDPDERALVDSYLVLDTSKIDWWIFGAIFGGLVCVGSIVLYFAAGGADHSRELLVFMVGLVLIDIAMDFRRNRKLTRILRKYEEAVGGGHTEGEGPSDAQG